MVSPTPQGPPLPAIENAENTEGAIRQTPRQDSAGRGREPVLSPSNATSNVLWTSEEKTITVENELYTAVVSSNGGGSFLSFSFKHYLDKDGQGVNLINGKNKENLSIRFKDLDGESEDLFGPWRYDNSFSGGEIYRPQSLEFSMDVFPGKRIVKTLTFYPDSYIVDVSINMGNVADRIFGGAYSFGWYGGLVPSEEN